MLHRHRRCVIQPVEIRQSLQIGFILYQFLGATMQKADMRVKPLNDFTVQFHHQTQNAVRCGVLWSKVDRVILDDFIASGRREILLHAHGINSPQKTESC